MKCAQCQSNYNAQDKPRVAYECGHQVCLTCMQQTRKIQWLCFTQQSLCLIHGLQTSHQCNTCQTKICQNCMIMHPGHYILPILAQGLTPQMQCVYCQRFYNDQDRTPVMFECGHEICLACMQKARQQSGWFCFTCKRISINPQYNQQKIQILKEKPFCPIHSLQTSHQCNTCQTKICQNCMIMHPGHYILQILAQGLTPQMQCSQCQQSYNQQTKTPHTYDCGHEICLSCMNQSSQQVWICRFCNNFSANFKYIPIQGSICQVHQLEFSSICFSCYVQICQQCEYQHQNHSLQYIQNGLNTCWQKFQEFQQGGSNKIQSIVDQKQNETNNLKEKQLRGGQHKVKLDKMITDTINKRRQTHKKQVEDLKKVLLVEQQGYDKIIKYRQGQNGQNNTQGGILDLLTLAKVQEALQKKNNSSQVEFNFAIEWKEDQQITSKIKQMIEKYAKIQAIPNYPKNSTEKNQLIQQKVEGNDQQSQDIQKIIETIKRISPETEINLEIIHRKYRLYKTVENTVANFF